MELVELVEDDTDLQENDFACSVYSEEPTASTPMSSQGVFHGERENMIQNK